MKAKGRLFCVFREIFLTDMNLTYSNLILSMVYWKWSNYKMWTMER